MNSIYRKVKHAFKYILMEGDKEGDFISRTNDIGVNPWSINYIKIDCTTISYKILLTRKTIKFSTMFMQSIYIYK